MPVGALAKTRLGFAARDAAAGDLPTLGVAPQGGVVITEVEEGGPADRVRLKAGDVLVGLGKDRVRTMDDLVDVLEMLRPGDVLELRVLRVGTDRVGRTGLRELSGRVEVR